MLFSVYFVVLLCVKLNAGMEKEMENAMVYLSKYGYLEPNSVKENETENLEILRKSLAEFQEFAGIEPTGNLDKETMTMIKMPRCGMKDKISSNKKRKFKKYVIEGSRWKVRNLKYKVTKYPKNLDRASVDPTIQKAFGLWSKYTPLTFEPTTGRAHIDIRFEEGRHGDGDAFDGPGGILAHAYFPQYGGATHFDDTESWSINTGRGTDLLQVATHEFGHALGLSHSDIKQAIMAPFYKGYIPNLNLYKDDVQAIQYLYGDRNTRGGGDDVPVGRKPGRTPRRRHPRRRFFPRIFPRLSDSVGYIPVYLESDENSVDNEV